MGLTRMDSCPVSPAGDRHPLVLGLPENVGVLAIIWGEDWGPRSLAWISQDPWWGERGLRKGDLERREGSGKGKGVRKGLVGGRSREPGFEVHKPGVGGS